MIDINQNNNKITPEHIHALLSASEAAIGDAFDKVTVMHVKLPNGFVITVSSACVDPANYDRETGVKLCQKQIVDKLYELEGYRLQCELNSLNSQPSTPSESPDIADLKAQLIELNQRITIAIAAAYDILSKDDAEGLESILRPQPEDQPDSSESNNTIIFKNFI